MYTHAIYNDEFSKSLNKTPGGKVSKAVANSRKGK